MHICLGDRMSLDFSNVKFSYKIFSNIALLGVVVGGAIWFATARMHAIDDTYSHIINNDVVAMRAATRANRR